MDIEEYRRNRETLDRIEAALTARIAKSDQYLPESLNAARHHLGTHQYSTREDAFRRWETRCLLEHYDRVANNLRSAQVDLSATDLNADLARAAMLEDNVPYVSEATRWQLNNNAKGLHRFSCAMTADLPARFDAEYPVPENFGQQVWLEPFYRKALAAGIIPESHSYTAYLANLRQFYTEHPSTPDVVDYLLQAYDRAHDFGPQTGTSALDLLKPKGPADSDPLWCPFCRRHFANENVYKAHLNGKKHKRVAAQATSNHKDTPRQEDVSDRRVSTSEASTQEDSLPKKETAHKNTPISKETSRKPPSINIVELIELMQPQIEETIAQIDRKSRMGLADREVEIAALEAERNAEDDWVSDDEHLGLMESNRHSSSTPHPSNHDDGVPRGPDGTPIPRWLYKLQGLGTIFKCEICAGAKYSGRKAFDRHFSDPRHVSGLAELGIRMTPAFNGIGTIEEVKALAEKLAKVGRSTLPIEKEVEDDEGNVMGERMYEDLKKQGLI